MAQNDSELREAITKLLWGGITDVDGVLTIFTAYKDKAVEEVLDRLEAELNEQKKAAETNLAYHADVTKNERLIRDWQGTVHGIEFCRPAIEAERNKLKGDN